MSKAAIRINRVDANIDEVFIYRDQPYVNRTIYAKSGLFSAGEFSDEEIAKLEQQSATMLAKERAAAVPVEAKPKKAGGTEEA